MNKDLIEKIIKKATEEGFDNGHGTTEAIYLDDLKDLLNNI